jgi:alkylation response protein AidB-like acyl-CoA dehydrogenase
MDATGRLVRKLTSETVEGVALINALRVEPDLGSPSRGGLPATIARKTETGWRLRGRKIYSTGAPILKRYTVWAKTDEPNVRVGLFLAHRRDPGSSRAARQTAAMMSCSTTWCFRSIMKSMSASRRNGWCRISLRPRRTRSSSLRSMTAPPATG